MADIDIIDSRIEELESAQERVIDTKSELRNIKRLASQIDEYDSDTTTLVIDHIDKPQIKEADENELQEGVRVEITTTSLSYRMKRMLGVAEWSSKEIASSIESDGEGNEMFVHTINLVYFI